MSLLKRLWNDDFGGVMTAEVVLLGTVAVVGATTGIHMVSQAVNEEMVEVSHALRSLDQSYSFEGMSSCKARTAGSCYTQPPVEESLKGLCAPHKEKSDDDDKDQKHEHKRQWHRAPWQHGPQRHPQFKRDDEHRRDDEDRRDDEHWRKDNRRDDGRRRDDDRRGDDERPRFRRNDDKRPERRDDDRRPERRRTSTDELIEETSPQELEASREQSVAELPVAELSTEVK